jgi:hypothetical protein
MHFVARVSCRAGGLARAVAKRRRALTVGRAGAYRAPAAIAVSGLIAARGGRASRTARAVSERALLSERRQCCEQHCGGDSRGGKPCELRSDLVHGLVLRAHHV